MTFVEYSQLSDSQREDQLRSLVYASAEQVSAKLQRLRESIAQYESRWGMSTAEMVCALDRGDLHFSDEIHDWLMVRATTARFERYSRWRPPSRGEGSRE